MKRVLVTGSSGQSGSEIIRYLKNRYEVIGTDLIAGPDTTYTGNLTERAFAARIMEGVDCVIHTAALHAPHVPVHSREEFIDTNIKGTLYLLEAAKASGVNRFIYTSTTSLYGEQMIDPEKAVWITEEVPPLPRDIYDITKIAAEQLCKDFFSKGNLETVVLRVSRFWDEPLDKKLYYRMYRGVDVRDVAEAHFLAISAELAEFQILNISADTIFTKEDVYQLKSDATAIISERVPELIPFFRSKGWDIPGSIDRVYVIEKAKSILNFAPRYNIREFIEELRFSKS